MPFKPSEFKPPVYSTIDGSPQPSIGVRDAYDAQKRAQAASDAQRRMQAASDAQNQMLRQTRQGPSNAYDAQRRPREFNPRSGGTHLPPPEAPTEAGPGTSSIAIVLRLVLFAVFLIYFLPLMWRPTPPALLDARKFITTSVDTAVEQIDELIRQASR